jgi:hypothetical protein
LDDRPLTEGLPNEFQHLGIELLVELRRPRTFAIAIECSGMQGMQNNAGTFSYTPVVDRVGAACVA